MFWKFVLLHLLRNEIGSSNWWRGTMLFKSWMVKKKNLLQFKIQTNIIIFSSLFLFFPIFLNIFNFFVSILLTKKTKQFFFYIALLCSSLTLSLQEPKSEKDIKSDQTVLELKISFVLLCAQCSLKLNTSNKWNMKPENLFVFVVNMKEIKIW